MSITTENQGALHSEPSENLVARSYDEVRAGIDHPYDRQLYDELSRVYWTLLDIATETDNSFRLRCVPARENGLSIVDQRKAKIVRRLSELAAHQEGIVEQLDKFDEGLEVDDGQMSLSKTYEDSLVQIAKLYEL